MLERRGVRVHLVAAEPGTAPTAEALGTALERHGAKALFVTHVDTSTGVRADADAEAMCGVARRAEVFGVFDGVCATAGERFDTQARGADVYLTASQKAIGLPAGLGLAVFSARAMGAREAPVAPPPLALGALSWLPIMKAYEERKPSYFATPPTTLIPALRVALDEILEGGVDGRIALHAERGAQMRAAWAALGLTLLPQTEELAANTLSAIRFPAGVGPELVAAIAKRDVVVAGGLLPALRTAYFRVGHMGDVLLRPERCGRRCARWGSPWQRPAWRWTSPRRSARSGERLPQGSPRANGSPGAQSLECRLISRT